VPPLGTSAPPPFGGPAPLVGPFPPPAVPSFGGPPVAPGPSPRGALPPIGSVPGTASPSQPPPIDPYAAAARPPSAPPYGGAYPAAPPPPAGGGASPSAPPRAEGGLHTGAFQLDMPTLALQGLRELASSLVPGRPLETTGDVVRLITKLHDTVDVFCRSFIPLRQGYAQFLSSLDLQRAAQQRAMNRSNAALTLESATTPQVLAMALLDPRDPSVDAPEAVEGILADLMLHQVALLDGVMEGVRALLDELSPTSIDAALAQKGGAGPFQAKHRARWDEFCARFERLSDERQAFSVIFGQSFADVYRQYWHRKAAEDRGLRSDPPRG
jgi:hypothetical protein